MPDPGRLPDVSDLTPAELERLRRDLTIAMALLRPGSPAAVPIAAQMTAIDTEIAHRAGPGPAASR